MGEAAKVSTVREDEVSIIDLGLIDIREGHNPRKFRAKKRMDEMRESVRADGVLQPILVRIHPETNGRYELVAGHTRFDLATDVGLPTIPALVKDVSDEDMLKLATSENVHRENMTPVDEGQAAKELLIKHSNDQDEVCRILGWSKTKLLGRMQLTHCIPEVSQALCDEEITVGHAQLLSGMREAAQPGGLKLVINDKLTTDDLRKRIEAQALRLKAAIFDKTDCEGCPHNSSQQSSLFGSVSETDRCLNKDCFSEKTQVRLVEQKAELAESFSTVNLDTDVAEGAYTLIATSGGSGVGQEQATACQGCSHYGALIATRLGDEGKVTKNVCFNVPCNTEKVDAYQSLIASEAEEAATPQTQAENGDGEPAEGATAAPAKKAKKAAKPTVAATPKAILAVNHGVHRLAAQVKVTEDGGSKIVTIMAILSMMSDSSQGFKTKPESWPTGLTGASRGKAFEILDSFDESKLQELLKGMAAKALANAKSSYGGENEGDTFGSMANYIAKSRQADLAKHFVMDEGYLKSHTKPVIETLLTGAGFDKTYDSEKGEGAFKKLMGEKKDDLLKAVTASKHDFTGFVPDSMKLD